MEENPSFTTAKSLAISSTHSTVFEKKPLKVLVVELIATAEAARNKGYFGMVIGHFKNQVKAWNQNGTKSIIALIAAELADQSYAHLDFGTS
jgi:hypothetical protein